MSAETLDTNYARAGYHHQLGFGTRPALLLIDFVTACFEHRSPLYANVEATVASQNLIRRIDVQCCESGLTQWPHAYASIPNILLGIVTDGVLRTDRGARIISTL